MKTHKRATFDQIQRLLWQRNYTRVFNEMTGLDYTPHQLQDAGESYVTPEFRSACRRGWNRGRMRNPA